MAVSPIHFIDYSKISDTLMWFDNSHVLKFCVGLQKKNKKGDIVPFHKEYTFINKSNNVEQITINRDYSFYFVIEDLKNKGFTSNTNAILYPSNVEFLRILLDKHIYQWFMIPTRDKIFGNDSNNRLFVKGAPKIQFPLNNRNYLEFRPIVIEFENTGEQKEGVRFIINDINNFMDITIDKFMEFGYIISNTDMANAAMNMLTYVKLRPYGENIMNLNENGESSFIAVTNNNGSNYTNNNNKKGFF